ncbi:hypothetical protein D0T53_10190 [Dysgonomonas sp. 216]|uniref:hypothetical protein n=1 Tax=Dysgonomonas sp. 216 TaxID=2302934 RepID=UPI0013D52989|nr:hypothetical protein [Dysgonomonas sp. 216]NDW19281.1 hypothetical protein [Dysgonomonas sp. 216]
MRKYILTALLSFTAGSIIFFLVGRSSIKIGTEVHYVQGETISGSVSNNQFEPVKEEKPDKPLLPTKEIEVQYRDTGSIRTITDIKYVYQVVDTAAIIEDYILKRSYILTAFDNKEHGKLLLYPTVQYNKLTGMDYSFTPMQKQKNTYLQKVWQPFISGSYSTLDYVGLGGGVFYHNLGFEYQYNIDIRNKPIVIPVVDDYFKRGNYHWFSGKYKF